MNTEPRAEHEIAPNPTKRNDNASLWRKLFSSNWWWYGAVTPDSATLPASDRRPRLWRAHMLPGFALWLFFLFVPTIVSLANYGLPEKEDIQTLRGEVVSASARSPHMRIRLVTGEVIDAEFPVQVAFYRGATTELFKEPVHKLVLTCGQVMLSGAYLHFLPVERFRIWDFSCVNGAFFVPENEIRKKWLQDRFTTHMYVSIISGLLLPLLLFAYFYRERKEYARKN